MFCVIKDNNKKYFLFIFLQICVDQELVNLLVCGRAVPNVFDNDMKLDSGQGNTTLLKGIKSQCDVGLLSLFEHYNICEVRTDSRQHFGVSGFASGF